MVGKELGDYIIVKELAEGGMGFVFEGISQTDDSPVAIKTLRKEFGKRREDVARFIREANIYKQLIHPNLMRFYAFGFDPTLGFYLVTELMVGRDLEEALADHGDKPLPTVEALDIALQICAGLGAAHERGIVHRDLKPGNIFLVKQHGAEVAKVFDFGIAKMLEGPDYQQQLTVAGAALGTPLYMAPEQIRGEQTVGPPADIYALGVIIFQMLAGRPPFIGANHMSILADHIRTAPPKLRKYNRSFSDTPIERLVDQMLAKDPSDRPPNLQQVKELLWTARQKASEEPSQGTLLAVPNFADLQAMFGPQAAKDTALSDTDDHASESAEGDDIIIGDDADTETQPDLPEAPPAESPVAVLKLKQGERSEEIGWLLPGEKLIIGNTAQADIRVRRPGVRAQHAEIHCAPGRWITIRSLEGATIRVNGAAVASMMLQHDDWITVGQAEIRLHCFSR